MYNSYDLAGPALEQYKRWKYIFNDVGYNPRGQLVHSKPGVNAYDIGDTLARKSAMGDIGPADVEIFIVWLYGLNGRLPRKFGTSYVKNLLNEQDPEYTEYLRLKEKFSSTTGINSNATNS
jgi:hypothetical protein